MLVTRNLLRKKFEDGDLSEGQCDKFIEAAVAFYSENLQYTLLNPLMPGGNKNVIHT